MNEAFEKAKARHLRGIEKEMFAEHDFTAGWQAAEAAMREPQTSETCQAVPPHPKGSLVRRVHFYMIQCPPPPACAGYVEVCLACEAVAKSRLERDADWILALSVIGDPEEGIPIKITTGDQDAAVRQAFDYVKAKAVDAALLEVAKARCRYCSEGKLQPARASDGGTGRNFLHWEVGYPEAAIRGGSNAYVCCLAQEEHRLREGKK